MSDPEPTEPRVTLVNLLAAIFLIFPLVGTGFAIANWTDATGAPQQAVLGIVAVGAAVIPYVMLRMFEMMTK